MHIVYQHSDKRAVWRQRDVIQRLLEVFGSTACITGTGATGLTGGMNVKAFDATA